MKVLEKGKNGSGWSKEVTCTGHGNSGGGCGAKLLVTKEDFFKTEEFEREGRGNIHYTIQCAECEVLTDVDSIPESIKSKITRTGGSSGPRRSSSDDPF